MGYDIHRLQKGRPFLLGGVRIRHTKGPVGHSDGDVLLHAICDALLGAAGCGDIGKHFPGTAKYKNISSLVLLSHVATIIRKQSLKVGHIDSVIVLERPKLSAYSGQMIQAIASSLKIGVRKVSIKAKTHDGLGLLGKEQAVAAWAIASLVKGPKLKRKKKKMKGKK
jgi:2-C-methyl-D-erythritol 2,4-cyclodiphosphate synthase